MWRRDQYKSYKLDDSGSHLHCIIYIKKALEYFIKLNETKD